MRIFKPFNNFMMRIPAFSINTFNKSTETDFVNYCLNRLRKSINSDFPEANEKICSRMNLALLIANINFLNKIRSYPSTSEIPIYIKTKFLYYLIRGSSRPTPFGLFTNVFLGNFEDKIDLKFNKSDISFKARANLSWISEIVSKLEKNESIIKKSYLIANPEIIKKGDRIFITKENVSKSIKLTTTINLIFDLLENKRVTYKKIFNNLFKRYPLQKKEIKLLIFKLINESFIITDLTPSFIEIDPLLYLTKKLHNTELGIKLSLINEKIRLLNKMQFDNFEANYISIMESINKLTNSQHTSPLRFETISLKKRVILPRHIGVNAAELAETLLRLSSSPKGYLNIDIYKNRFEEKYGTKRMVNLLELLNNQLGLGSPYTSKDGVIEENKKLKERNINSTLINLVAKALYEHTTIINLDEKTIKKLETWNPNLITAPDSMNIYIKIYAKTVMDITEGNYFLSITPAGGNIEALSSFSRFQHVFGADLNDLTNAIVTQETKLQNPKLITEVFTFPKHKNAFDLNIHLPFYKYAIFTEQIPKDINEVTQIYLNDIYIGIKNNKFFIYSRSLNQELYIQNTTSINEDIMPEVIRFLIDISNHSTQPTLNLFNWRQASNFPFLPRIVFKNFILSLARWNISTLTISYFDLSTFTLFFDSFQKWRAKWYIPKFIFLLGQYDFRQLLNLVSKEHVQLLYYKIKELTENKLIVFEEAIDPEMNLFAEGEDGLHITEFVVPLVKVKANELKNDDENIYIKNIMKLIDSQNYDNIKNWIFIKLYINKDSQDNFIITHLKTFCSNNFKKWQIKEWFFLKYKDPEDHIRLRLKSNSKLLIKELLLNLYTWGNNLTISGVCSKFSIDLYEPEIERYGGIEGMNLANKVFYYDSQLVLNLLSYLSNNKISDKIILCAFSIDILLNKLGMDFEHRLKLYRKIVVGLKYNGDNKFDDKLTTLSNYLINPENIPFEIKNSIIDVLNLDNVSKQLSGTWEKLSTLNLNKELTAHLDSIIESYIHMHCNRLFGVEQKMEIETYILLKRANEIKYYNLNKNTKFT